MFISILYFITAWYNLPFTILLVLGMFLAILQLIGLGGDQDQDSDADLDHDLDTDLDHDIDLDHDADLDHDLDVDHDVDLDHDADLDHDVDSADHGADGGADGDTDGSTADSGGSTLSLLAFLGVGKAPLLIVLLLLFFLVGMSGWVINGIAQSVFNPYPGILFAFVLPASLIAGAGVSSRITRFIGQALPPISTTATRAQALVGMRGTVISPFVDEKYGQVHLRNQDNTLITVFAVNETPDVIKRGQEVILVSYNAAQRLYLVVPSNPN